MNSNPAEKIPIRRRIRLTFEYDGTDFVGWQKQQNGPSVQAELEQAIEKLTQERVFVRAAGRTDAGVHALGQVGHFETFSSIAVDKFHTGLNFFLPPSISIRAAVEVPDSFEARLSAQGKLYRYQLLDRPSRSPIHRHFAWHIYLPLHVERMHAAAQSFVGTHNFDSFRASDCERDNPVRTIHAISVARQHQLVTIDVHGNAFLKYMVRILVGTLMEIGVGKRDPATISALLANPDRTLAGMTAPPHGLFLAEVYYPPTDRESH